VQHHRTWIDMPGLRHGKLFVGRPCKKRADDLLKYASAKNGNCDLHRACSCKGASDYYGPV